MQDDSEDSLDRLWYGDGSHASMNEIYPLGTSTRFPFYCQAESS